MTLCDLKGGMQGPSFSGRSYIHLYRLTNRDQIWHVDPCGGGMCFRAHARPYPRGGALSRPNFLGIPIYALTLFNIE